MIIFRFIILLALITFAPTVSFADIAALPPAAQSLIDQAGNTDSETQRLSALRRLRNLKSLDDSLRQQTDRLISEIERYNNDPNLSYFARPVLNNADYDFGIPQESPLYVFTRLYRGRMIVWVSQEYSTVWNVDAKRREFLDRARTDFLAYKQAFPRNRIAAMYLGERLPAEKQYLRIEGAPEWAVYQREAIERLTDIIEWWADRQRPDGSYGGGWGDDCEMWRWWTPILIGFDSPRITRAQARLSKAIMSLPEMSGGYTSYLYDVEHTSEDSSDSLTPMMLLEPDNKIWSDAAMRIADLMENLWMGTNERGQFMFKSTYFSATQVSEDPRLACDTVYHLRAAQPLLLYWQRTKDPRLTKLFTAWMDTWVDAAARTERGKPAGIIPSAIHWPDGNVGGTGADWWNPNNHDEPRLYEWPSTLSYLNNTLLLTYFMTGNEKYLEPIRSMARIREQYLSSPDPDPKPGTAQWCGSKLGLLSDTLIKHKFLTGSTEFNSLLSREKHAYYAFRARGDRAALIKAFAKTAEALRYNFQGYTSEVRWTDRVLMFPRLFNKDCMYKEKLPGFNLPNIDVLYTTITGDLGGGYFYTNAVRWLTGPREIAALVTDSGAYRFRAELFHFGERPRKMSAEFYLLSPGDYHFVVKPAGSNVAVVDKKIKVDGQRTQVEFTLPPRTLCEVIIER